MKNVVTTTNKRLQDGDVFEQGGRLFKLRIDRDEGMREPWIEHDGHGIISNWTKRAKAPGERILISDRDSYRYYDVAGTMKTARRDGWGIGDDELQKLKDRLGGEPTRAEVTARAVELDFERMWKWCTDQWYWVYVQVTLLKADKDAPRGYFETIYSDSVGGIESDADEYLSDTARELADGIIGGWDIREP